MDSWQEFLELGRSRGWFWPENRSFLTSLVGEEKSKKIPIEPRRHNTPALEGSTIDSHLERYELIYLTFRPPSPLASLY